MFLSPSLPLDPSLLYLTVRFMTRKTRSGEKRQHEKTWQDWCRWGNNESLFKRKWKKREKKYGVERHCWLLCLPLFHTHGGGQLLGTPLLASKFSSTDWTHTHKYKHKNWPKLNFFFIAYKGFPLIYVHSTETCPTPWPKTKSVL